MFSSSNPMRATRPGGIGRAEPDRHDGLAERTAVTYICQVGADHPVVIVLARTAEPPDTWTCPRHGVDAFLRPSPSPTPAAADSITIDKPVRTPWVMLRERRSIAELDQHLDERLALLHARRAEGLTKDGCA